MLKKTQHTFLTILTTSLIMIKGHQPTYRIIQYSLFCILSLHIRAEDMAMLTHMLQPWRERRSNGPRMWACDWGLSLAIGVPQLFLLLPPLSRFLPSSFFPFLPPQPFFTFLCGRRREWCCLGVSQYLYLSQLPLSTLIHTHTSNLYQPLINSVLCRDR